jgi:hypothetical protein
MISTLRQRFLNSSVCKQQTYLGQSKNETITLLSNDIKWVTMLKETMIINPDRKNNKSSLYALVENKIFNNSTWVSTDIFRIESVQCVKKIHNNTPYDCYVIIVSKSIRSKKQQNTKEEKKECYIIDVSQEWMLIWYGDIDIFDDEIIFFFTRNSELYQWKWYNYERYKTAHNSMKIAYPKKPFYLSTIKADPRSYKAAEKLAEEWTIKKIQLKNGRTRYQFM